MKTTLYLLTSVALIAAAVFARHAERQMRATAGELAQMQRQRGQYRAELQRADARRDEAQKTHAGLRSFIARADQARTDAVSGVSALKPSVDRNAPDWPEKFQRILEQRRPQQAQRVVKHTASMGYQWATVYAGFFHQAGFTPAQGDRFIGRLQRTEAQIADLKTLVEDGIISGDDPVIARMMEKIQAERSADMAELLSPTGRSYQEFVDEYVGPSGLKEAARSILAGMAGAAVVVGTPFSAAQVEQLTAILVHESEFSPHAFGAPYTYNVDWQTVDEQARPILTDAQWHTFTTVPGATGSGAIGGGRIDNVFRRAIFDAAQADSTPPVPPTRRPSRG